MGKAAPIKTDLIIGMTLAETFLLILFIVWYSQGAGAGPDWQSIAEGREKQIKDLKHALQIQTDEARKWKKLVEWWRTIIPTSPPGSMEELDVALHSVGFAITKVEKAAKGTGLGGRSNLTPPCSELHLKERLLETVIVIRGRDSYEVNAQEMNFQELLSSYKADLNKASDKCRYLITVSFSPDVRTDDYVFALKQLRSTFYAQLQ